MTASRDIQESMFPDLVPARPQGWIMPSVFRGDNAELMKAIAPMYLTGSVLDVTYGNGDTAGGWWRRFTPDPFTFHDLALDGVDFRSLPEDDDSIDTVCYDSPYVASGGSATADTAADFRDRFGIDRETHYGGETESLNLVVGGLLECLRVARCFVLVKCMEFTSSRRFHDFPYEVTKAALQAGATKHDVIVHHTGSGPGGHNIFTPIRARRHHSYLLVFTPGGNNS